MLTIKSGGHEIYNPMNPNLKVINPVLTMEDNTSGSLSFRIYQDNANFDYVSKLYPIISVFRDNHVIFKGRVISDTKDFYNGKSIEVEGKLAFLNDSVLRPFEFAGSPRDLFDMIIDNHNKQVSEWQRFRVGEVTVTDPNDYIVRSSEKSQKSWDALKDKCFQSGLGGHVRIRYENDGDYIDWLEDYTKLSGQSIEFAKNLLDLSVNTDASETYTAILPIGAEVEGKAITISSVNDGKDYLINEEKAAEYGIIYAPVEESTWGDVTQPENLLRKAKEKLYHSFPLMNESYEIRAVDLNLTDRDVEALDVCEYVSVRSIPHGIDSRYLLYKMEIHMDEPQNSVFNLGVSRRTFADFINSYSGKSADIVIPTNVSQLKNDSSYATTDEVKETVVTAIGELGEISKGEKGDAGVDGVNGQSAYEIACSNGFAGSETEWLASLKGEKGEKGDTGEKGEKGDKGDSGAEYEILSVMENIEGNTEKGKLVDALLFKAVFQSVSDGKKLLASAITGKGVATDATSSFEVMAGNIANIEGGSGASGSFTITCEPSAGSTLVKNDKIILTCSEENAELYYSTDGSNPVSSGTLYHPEEGIVVTKGIADAEGAIVLKVIAVLGDMVGSVDTITFLFDKGKGIDYEHYVLLFPGDNKYVYSYYNSINTFSYHLTDEQYSEYPEIATVSNLKMVILPAMTGNRFLNFYKSGRTGISASSSNKTIMSLSKFLFSESEKKLDLQIAQHASFTMVYGYSYVNVMLKRASSEEFYEHYVLVHSDFLSIGTVSQYREINISAKYDGYKSLTKEDFVIYCTKLSVRNLAVVGNGAEANLYLFDEVKVTEYNPEEGIVKLFFYNSFSDWSLQYYYDVFIKVTK